MAERADISSGELTERYRIESVLGQGGMATVYRAHDLRHDRSVAVKVVRPELVTVLGPERFLREIRVTANLHHPNIIQLYDSGESGGNLYYVMPSIEGETLRDRIDRDKQLPIDEAVSVAAGIADALDYAHRHGVIHRDIKPENILLHDGKPLVADFGIALAMSRLAGDRLTETGLSLGTPAYMSPEQATGDRALQASSDIYALGCLLYEMLAGDPPFTGSNVQAVIARVVVERPARLRTLRPTVPLHIDAAVDRALAKVPADRFATAREFANALTEGGRVRPVPIRWRRGLPYAAAVGAAAIVLWGVLTRLPGPQSATVVRQLTGFQGWEWAPSWSPDGSMLAYSHIVEGDADVATLSAGGGDPHILTAASPADEISPAWSPDGRMIAYISDRGGGTDVYWIAPTGGVEHKVAETHIPFLERMGAWGSALGRNPWSPDSRELLFSRLEDNGDVAIWKVNLDTREETRLTSPPAGAEDGGASWSPDGRQIVYAQSAGGARTLLMIPAKGGEPVKVLDDPTVWPPAWYPDSRRLVLSSVRGGAVNLWELTVGSGAMRQLTVGAGIDWAPSVSGDGSIAYVQFGHQIDLYWISLDDPKVPHQRLTTFTGDNFGARVSPDGNRIVYLRGPPHDLWILDRRTGQHRQLTDHPAADRLCDWSPKGDEIVFMSDRDGAVRLWVVDVETGATRRLSDQGLPWSLHSAEGQSGPRWSPGGGTIGYIAPTDSGTALWLIAPDGSDRRATAIRDPQGFGGWYLDDQRIVYTRRGGGESTNIEMRAANLATGEDVLLYRGPIAEVTVSPDGAAVTYIEAVSHFTMELYRLRLKPAESPHGLPQVSGSPEQLTHGNGEWHVHSGGWAPDGSGMVYSRDRDFGDIFVIEPTP